MMENWWRMAKKRRVAGKRNQFTNCPTNLVTAKFVPPDQAHSNSRPTKFLIRLANPPSRFLVLSPFGVTLFLFNTTCSLLFSISSSSSFTRISAISGLHKSSRWARETPNPKTRKKNHSRIRKRNRRKGRRFVLDSQPRQKRNPRLVKVL